MSVFNPKFTRHTKKQERNMTHTQEKVGETEAPEKEPRYQITYKNLQAAL